MNSKVFLMAFSSAALALTLSADTYTDPREVLGSQVGDDGFQSVMPPGAPFHTDPQHAFLQVDVVGDHQDVLRRDLVEIRRCPEALTRIVHIGLGLQKQHLLRAKHPLSAQGKMFFFIHLCPHPLRQTVDDMEACIMTCILVFPARISQARNNIHSQYS